MTSGSHITWMYQMIPEIPAWTESVRPDGRVEWIVRQVGIHQVKIQASNQINVIQESTAVTVINAPEIENVKLSSGENGFSSLNSIVSFEVMLSEDSEEATEYEWTVINDDTYETISGPSITQTVIWSYTLSNYGRYRFRLKARNDVGESEPYPLTIVVYEPIENFQIVPLSVTRTVNAVALGIHTEFVTNHTLGNNITYTMYPYGVDGESHRSNVGTFEFTYQELGTFLLTIRAENTLSAVESQLQVIVQDRVGK